MLCRAQVDEKELIWPAHTHSFLFFYCTRLIRSDPNGWLLDNQSRIFALPRVIGDLIASSHKTEAFSDLYAYVFFSSCFDRVRLISDTLFRSACLEILPVHYSPTIISITPKPCNCTLRDFTFTLARSMHTSSVLSPNSQNFIRIVNHMELQITRDIR